MIKQVYSLSYAKFSQEYEMHPCQAVSLGEKVMRVNLKQYFARHAAYLSPAAAHGTHRVRRMF